MRTLPFAVACLFLTFAAGVKSSAQLVLSTCSMVVWIYAMGTGPLRFVRAPYYEPWHGAVLLALWTLVPPMILTQAPVPADGTKGRARSSSSARGPSRRGGSRARSV